MAPRRLNSRAFDYSDKARDNYIWPDHIARLLQTGAMIAWIGPSSICDPACGDGSVLEAAYRLRPFSFALLGDISRPNIEKLNVTYPAQAQVSDALEMVGTLGNVDCIVLTEILEHLEDPKALLRAARSKATSLVASSPIDEDPNIANPEHIWAFSVDDYRQMLEDTGWHPIFLSTLTFTANNLPYSFQIWGAG